MAQQHPSTSVRRFHPRTRDLWVVNLRRATSWMAVGSVGVAAALVGLAAYETPSHHTTGTTSPGSTSSGTATNPGSTATGGAPGATSSAGSTAAATAGSTGTGSATSGTATRAPASTSGSVVSPGAGSAHVSTGLS